MRKIVGVLLCLALAVVPVRGEAEVKYAALTFDDGPSGRFTRRLLEGLETREAKGTFLLCGYRMEQYPELTEAIYQGGHEIGFHGYSHDCMGCMSRGDIARELARSRSLLPKGCVPVFVRPPGGSMGTAVREEAAAEGLAVLSWNVDPKDWATHQADKVIRSVVSQVKDGDVVLLHDMSDSSVDAALAIADALMDKGFRLVTVSELANIRGDSLSPGMVYSQFPPN